MTTVERQQRFDVAVAVVVVVVVVVVWRGRKCTQS